MSNVSSDADQVKSVIDIADHITIKIVVVGDYGVGKTSLVDVLHGDQFPHSPEPTICAMMMLPNMHGKQVQLWDTAGTEKFRAILPIYYRNADIIMICVNYDNEKITEKFEEWEEEVLANFSEAQLSNIKVIKVVTKYDLKDSGIINAFPFTEDMIATSAKTGEGVDMLRSKLESIVDGVVLSAITAKQSFAEFRIDNERKKCC